MPHDDPWIMYLVVRSDLPMDLAAAVALAGGATVACSRTLAGDERFAAAFAAWHATSYRKVALRAGAERFERLAAAEPGVVATHAGEAALLCLPPRRRSAAGDELAALRGFSDARRPEEPTPAPAPDAPALTYVIAAHLRMTQGKAMAQAGHGALMCADSPVGDRGPAAGAWAAWAAAGRPGRVLAADRAVFAAVEATGAGVVVRDRGLTQVAAGSETVVCLPPSAVDELPDPVRALM
jgi:peptidyl-tRNA hydrolase